MPPESNLALETGSHKNAFQLSACTFVVMLVEQRCRKEDALLRLLGPRQLFLGQRLLDLCLRALNLASETERLGTRVGDVGLQESASYDQVPGVRLIIVAESLAELP